MADLDGHATDPARIDPGRLVERLRAIDPVARRGGRRRDRGRPGARPRQPDRRAHRLQRRVRDAGRDRARAAAGRPPDRRPPRRSSPSTRPARRRRSTSTRSARRPRTWIDYVAGTAWALGEAGLRDARVPRPAGLDRAAGRRPVVVRGARDGLGPGAARAGEHGPGRAAGDPRPAGGERLRRRPVRGDGPVRVGGRRRRAGDPARLPIARRPARAAARRTSGSSSATAARRTGWRRRSTTSAGRSATGRSPRSAAWTRPSPRSAT